MIKKKFPFMRAVLFAAASIGLLIVFWVLLMRVPWSTNIHVPKAFIDPNMHEIEWVYVHNPAVRDYAIKRRIRCFLNDRMILHSAFPEIVGETSADYLGTTRLRNSQWTLRVVDDMTDETVSTNFTVHGIRQIRITPNPLRVIISEEAWHWVQYHNKTIEVIACYARKT
jgi:hypothetical protein